MTLPQQDDAPRKSYNSQQEHPQEEQRSGGDECFCGVRVIEGRYLCVPCVQEFSRLIKQAWELHADLLEVAIPRLDRVHRAWMPAQKEQSALPLNLEAVAVKDELQAALKAVQPETREHLIADPCSPIKYRRLQRAVHEATTLVDLPVEEIYLGQCGNIVAGVECAQDLSMPKQQQTVQCTACGCLWDVRRRQKTALQNAWWVVGPAAKVVETLSIHGIDVTVAQIKNWTHRGYIQRHPDPKTGKLGYRVSEVYEAACARKKKNTLP